MRLEMGMDQRLQLQQKLVLAPMIIQSIEILQLPQMNLLEYVEQQLQENEALEVETPEDQPPVLQTGQVAEAAEPSDLDKLLEFVPREFVPEDWEEFRYRKPSPEERDRKLEALQNSPDRPMTLQDRLADQLHLVEADGRVLDLAREIVYSLDERGMFAPHRFARALLEASDASGSLTKPLLEIVASVDGVAAVKVPAAKSGVTPEEIATARESRDRELQEAQQVLSMIERIRSAAVAASGANALPGDAMPKLEVERRYPLADLLQRLEERDGRVYTHEEGEAALRIVQSLEPRGIGGRTEAEVLLLQLDPEDLLYPEKRRLLERHLDDVTKNRLQKVAREMDLSIEDVQCILEELKDLDPSPGTKLAPVAAPLVHPDVVVWDEDGKFKVDLVNSQLPALTVREDFVKLMNDRDAATAQRDMARKRVENARWLIDAIAQRQATLTRVAERIFDHQSAWLEHGEIALRPLKMQTVADELGIHVSTVSRAIADKWVQTPRGIRPLKYYFTGGTENESGEVESRLNVKNRVKEIIDGEDGGSPLSDDDVAAKLKEQGLDVARRTVTKYRKQLGIPSSRQRRQWVG